MPYVGLTDIIYLEMREKRIIGSGFIRILKKFNFLKKELDWTFLKIRSNWAGFLL